MASVSIVLSVSSKKSKEKKSRKKIIWKIIKTYEWHLDYEIEENRYYHKTEEKELYKCNLDKIKIVLLVCCF
jgi:hypothetical protein